MPYEFSLEEDFDTEPFADAMSTQHVEFILGYDLDDAGHGQEILMSVMLVPDSASKNRIDGRYELMFGIRKRSTKQEWKVTEPDFTIETSREFIPKTERAKVLECVVRAVEGLIIGLEPEEVLMETYYPGLEPEALAKYEPIIDLFVDNGYEVEEGLLEPENHNYWTFTTGN